MVYAASSTRPRSVTFRRPTRWICTSEPVQCHRCGMEWEHGDPALTLPCAGCGADAGEPCQRRSGGNETVCIKRDRAAEAAGLLRPCERLTWDGRHTKPLRLSGVPLPHMLPVLTGEPGAVSGSDLASYDHIIVACSFGKDSLACTLHLLECGVPPERIEWWHHLVEDEADVFDWPHVTDYGRHLADALGVNLYFSARQGGIVREMLREDAPTAPVWFDTPEGRVTMGGHGSRNTRRRFPQMSANLSVRWCSPYAKIMVADTALCNQARFHHARTLFVTGERAAESANRARYAAFEPHRSDLRDGRARRHVDHYRPVHGWSEAEVWECLHRHGVIAPLPYRLGFGRLSCLTCIFMSANQAATLRYMDGQRFAGLCAWERAFGCTIRRDRDLWALADTGEVFAPVLARPDLVRRALSRRWRGPVLCAPSHWQMPAGAFGENAGPV